MDASSSSSCTPDGSPTPTTPRTTDSRWPHPRSGRRARCSPRPGSRRWRWRANCRPRSSPRRSTISGAPRRPPSRPAPTASRSTAPTATSCTSSSPPTPTSAPTSTAAPSRTGSASPSRSPPPWPTRSAPASPASGSPRGTRSTTSPRATPTSCTPPWCAPSRRSTSPTCTSHTAVTTNSCTPFASCGRTPWSSTGPAPTSTPVPRTSKTASPMSSPSAPWHSPTPTWSSAYAPPRRSTRPTPPPSTAAARPATRTTPPSLPDRTRLTNPPYRSWQAGMAVCRCLVLERAAVAPSPEAGRCPARDRECDVSGPESGALSQPGGDFAGSEGGVVRGAFDDDADRGVAVAVADVQDRPLGAEGVCLAPLGQCHQNGPQVPALAGQAVFVAGAAAGLLVGDGLQDAGRGQLAEAVAEHGFREADVAVEVVEAADAVDGVTQDQQCPFLPDHVERALDGAVLRARLKPLHPAMGGDLASP